MSNLWFTEDVVEQVKEDFDYTKYYSVPKESLGSTDFWSNKFYAQAYDCVKDRLAPVVVPTYNRPENLFAKYYYKNTVEGHEWPVYYVVRESQKATYENSQYIKDCKNAHVLAFEDSLIDDIGKVRKQIVEYFKDREKLIFMFDDDLHSFAYSVPFERETGSKISFANKADDFGKFMAMWQIASEYAIAKKPSTILTCGLVQGFSWGQDFCYEKSSLAYMCGPHTLAVGMNLNAFKEFDVNYRTIKGNGHDDIDLLIRALLKGATTCEFKWLSYASTGIGTDIYKMASVNERFAMQYNEMRANFPDVPFIKWRNRKGLLNVGINWLQVVKYHKDHTHEDFTDRRHFNLWRDGKIIEDAKNNYEGVEKWPH